MKIPMIAVFVFFTSQTFLHAHREVGKLLHLLKYTKDSHAAYNADTYDIGYHTFVFNGIMYQGQRNPADRLQKIPKDLFDFTHKTVLDIGCNQGGMLFALKNKIRWGVGVDYNPRLINAANRIRRYYSAAKNLDFYMLDVEQEPLSLFKSFLPANAEKVDICFLLSLCMWLKNWREVINAARALSPRLLFESNGSVEQQKEQVQYLKQKYSTVTLLADQSTDDPGQKERKLYFCRS